MPSRQPYRRSERVGDLLREILSETLMKEVHHQGLEGVTITGVQVSDDLQHARVYYRVIDQNQKDAVAKQLPKLKGFLRREAGRQMKMKYTPALTFEYDESLEYGHRIDSLLATIPKPEESE